MTEGSTLPAHGKASLAMIARVAGRLGADLRDEVAFLGGATLALLLTDPAAGEVRPTDDVDVIINVLTYGQYARLRERLTGKGFQEDTAPGAPVCRWRVDGITVDIMPTDETILGFSNRWYPGALQTAQPYHLPPAVQGDQTNAPQVIRLVTPVYFLATKLEAFAGRGAQDVHLSHDIEDIIALADGRPELPNEVAGRGVASHDPEPVRAFIAGALGQLLSRADFEEAVEGHLPPDARNRLRLVMERLRALAST